MKNLFFFLLTILLLLGCENEAKLTFETTELKNKSCNDCPKIKITIPRALGETRIAEKVNTIVDEELIYYLKFEDSSNVNSVEQAMASFSKGYRSFKNEFNDEAIGWEAKANGEISYENAFLLSIILDTYTYTGGAHGHSESIFLNFDKEKNVELENYQLFKDLEGFIDFAETKFRNDQEIPEQGSINGTGFMFSGEVFHLPENLGFTKEGVQLIYNQYEVASYADGAIELLIPYADANQFLKEKYRVPI